jgi:aminoglycoside 3-N-acetyltransferase
MSVLSYREIQRGLRDLGLTTASRVLALVSLPALGEVRGGAEAVAGALTAQCGWVLSPAFTTACQVIPPVGPADNALDYGDHMVENGEAEIFRPDVPVDPSLGLVAEVLRLRVDAHRSTHPLLSFVAVGAGAEKLLLAQSLAEPLGPIARLAEDGGEVLLVGANHTANIALHYAEYRAGRKQFIRWALTAEGVVECVGWPGCARGFEAIANRLRNVAQMRQIGAGCVQRLPLADVLRIAEDLIRADPTALLCSDAGCARCNAVRAEVKA